MRVFCRDAVRDFNLLTVSPRMRRCRVSPERRALPNLLLLGAMWGLLPSCAKLLIQAGAPPLWLPALSGGGAALILFLLCRARRLALPLDRAHLAYYAAVGVTGLTLANGAGYIALSHIPAGFYVLLLPLSPILTTVFSVALGGERAGPRVWAGVACGFAGAALAMSPGAALPNPEALPFALLALATPTLYAVSNVCAMRLAPRGTPPLPLAAGTLGVGALTLAPIAALAGPTLFPPGLAPAAILALFAVTMAAAYLVYFRLMASAGAIVTSLVGYTVTLFGIFWGAALFGERPGWLVLPAGALIFVGLALVTLRRRSGSAPR
jgi:drug/metabolite transporter (DMT)-like permease